METKKKYSSTKLYSDKYNKTNLSVQLDRKLLTDLKSFLSNKDISMKKYIEDLITSSIK